MCVIKQKMNNYEKAINHPDANTNNAEGTETKCSVDFLLVFGTLEVIITSLDVIFRYANTNSWGENHICTTRNPVSPVGRCLGMFGSVFFLFHNAKSWLCSHWWLWVNFVTTSFFSLVNTSTISYPMSIRSPSLFGPNPFTPHQICKGLIHIICSDFKDNTFAFAPAQQNHNLHYPTGVCIYTQTLSRWNSQNPPQYLMVQPRNVIDTLHPPRLEVWFYR